MNKYPTHVRLHFNWAGTVGQGSVLEEKLQYLVESLLPTACLARAWVSHEWSYSHKSFEPLFSGKKKEIPTVCSSGNGKTIETIKRSMDARNLGGECR